jgi:dimethylhistidine N-methyltransferase
MDTNESRLELIEIETGAATEDLADAVRSGLGHDNKTLPCRFFYDEEGSRIFEQICDLPEYYPTRTERQILADNADELAALFEDPTVLVELGSGSATKTRLVIEAFLRRHGELRYVPVDISRSILEESALELLARYPALEVTAIAAEYHQGLRKLRASNFKHKFERKLILWLGSSIGNFSPDAAESFLRRVHQSMAAGDRLLIGMDLRKEPGVLERAYDDSDGVTAKFNKNLLRRINRELGADFDLESFDHRSVWNDDDGRVEMHLQSKDEQVVAIEDLDMQIRFDKGETIHTECSYKYSLEQIEEMGARSGYRLERQWLDTGERFSVNLFAPICSS